MEDKIIKKLTVEEAKAQGYKYFFAESHDICYGIEDAQDFAGRKLFLAKESDSIALDPQWIIESHCEDLFEDAASRVYHTDEYEAFKKACEDINKNLANATQSYSVTDIELIVIPANAE